MPPLTARTIFAVLGPLFLLLAVWRSVGGARNPVQARTWLVIGVIFSAVAAWLYVAAP